MSCRSRVRGWRTTGVGLLRGVVLLPENHRNIDFWSFCHRFVLQDNFFAFPENLSEPPTIIM